MNGKRHSVHHHLLEVTFETATVLEMRQKLLYTTPSWWWWCIESVFRLLISLTLLLWVSSLVLLLWLLLLLLLLSLLLVAVVSSLWSLLLLLLLSPLWCVYACCLCIVLMRITNMTDGSIALSTIMLYCSMYCSNGSMYGQFSNFMFVFAA